MHADDPMSGPSATRPDFSTVSFKDEEFVPPLPKPEPAFDGRALLRRLLVCNPFFLCSAALLLFGLNRLSLDPAFLSGEEAKLIFNFSALQFYQVLVVGTALVLMRRCIWYDSALLVVVDSGLLLVPFILISQGIMIDRELGMTLQSRRRFLRPPVWRRSADGIRGSTCPTGCWLSVQLSWLPIFSCRCGSMPSSMRRARLNGTGRTV